MATGTFPATTGKMAFLSGHDLNNEPDFFCFLDVDTNTLNTPNVTGNYKRGMVINFPYSTGTSSCGQLFMSKYGNYMYYRTKYAGTWGDWISVIPEPEAWKSLTNATVHNGTVYYRKTGRIVEVILANAAPKAGGTSGTTLILGTLPSGYIPPKGYPLSGNYRGKPFEMYIDPTSGEIRFGFYATYTTSDRISFYVTYVV